MSDSRLLRSFVFSLFLLLTAVGVASGEEVAAMNPTAIIQRIVAAVLNANTDDVVNWLDSGARADLTGLIATEKERHSTASLGTLLKYGPTVRIEQADGTTLSVGVAGMDSRGTWTIQFNDIDGLIGRIMFVATPAAPADVVATAEELAQVSLGASILAQSTAQQEDSARIYERETQEARERYADAVLEAAHTAALAAAVEARKNEAEVLRPNQGLQNARREDIARAENALETARLAATEEDRARLAMEGVLAKAERQTEEAALARAELTAAAKNTVEHVHPPPPPPAAKSALRHAQQGIENKAAKQYSAPQPPLTKDPGTFSSTVQAPQSTFSPIGATDRASNAPSDSRLVNFLLATTRSLDTSELPRFTAERSATLSYGVVQVHVPLDHNQGQIEQPWRFGLFGTSVWEEKLDGKKHFVVRSMRVLD